MNAAGGGGGGWGPDTDIEDAGTEGGGGRAAGGDGDAGDGVCGVASGAPDGAVNQAAAAPAGQGGADNDTETEASDGGTSVDRTGPAATGDNGAGGAEGAGTSGEVPPTVITVPHPATQPGVPAVTTAWPLVNRKPILRWTDAKTLVLLEYVTNDIASALRRGEKRSSWPFVAAALAQWLPGCTPRYLRAKFNLELDKATSGQPQFAATAERALVIARARAAAEALEKYVALHGPEGRARARKSVASAPVGAHGGGGGAGNAVYTGGNGEGAPGSVASAGQTVGVGAIERGVADGDVYEYDGDGVDGDTGFGDGDVAGGNFAYGDGGGGGGGGDGGGGGGAGDGAESGGGAFAAGSTGVRRQQSTNSMLNGSSQQTDFGTLHRKLEGVLGLLHDVVPTTGRGGTVTVPTTVASALLCMSQAVLSMTRLHADLLSRLPLVGFATADSEGGGSGGDAGANKRRRDSEGEGDSRDPKSSRQ